MTIARDKVTGAAIGQVVVTYDRDGKPRLRILGRDGRYMNLILHQHRLEEISDR